MKSKNTKIYLQAYLDNNIGDDLMVMGLLREFNEYQFYTVSKNSMVINTFKEFDNINFISRKEFFKNITNKDLYIKIGGSIFQYNNYRILLAKIINALKLKLLKRKGVKTCVIGSNLGPYKVKGSHFVAKSELKTYDLVTVRDRKSFDIIKNKYKINNVFLFDDIVFELLDEMHIKEKRNNSNNILGISAYRSITRNEINYSFYNSLSKQIANLYNLNKIEKIKLFAFDTELENDLSAAHHIKNILHSKFKIKSEVIPYLGDNISEFVSEFSSVDFMISIRFHATILSDYYGIPYYPISYSNKTKNYVYDNKSHKNVFSVDEFINSNKLIDLNDFCVRESELNKGHINEIKKIINQIN